MNRKERDEKRQAEIASAMAYTLEHLWSFLLALMPLRKGNTYRQYTKKGPGRKHQPASKAKLRERAFKAEQRVRAS